MLFYADTRRKIRPNQFMIGELKMTEITAQISTGGEGDKMEKNVKIWNFYLNF